MNKRIFVLVFFIAVAFFAGLGVRVFRLPSYPEINEIESKTDWTFPELSKYFTALTKAKGAEYSFEVLRRGKFPPNTDMHLLAHVVGDMLFKQRGAAGITICTQDFRNACSHSILVGLFLKNGEAALPEITDVCKKAPGGLGAYTLCMHGLGHGILAYTGYEVPKAVEYCKKTGTPAYGYREIGECVGGIVMELISGGFHDIELWKKQSIKYLSKEDPLMPCMESYVPDEARPACLNYLTPHMIRVAGGDLVTRPSNDVFVKTFGYCDRLREDAVVYRDACFGGLGKEFVVMVQTHDIRKVKTMADDKLQEVYNLCLLAKNPSGVQSCLNAATNSLFWGGENDRGIALSFCRLMPSQQYQAGCFRDLIGAVFYYIKDPDYRKSFCGELPSIYQQECYAQEKSQ